MQYLTKRRLQWQSKWIVNQMDGLAIDDPTARAEILLAFLGCLPAVCAQTGCDLSYTSKGRQGAKGPVLVRKDPTGPITASNLHVVTRQSARAARGAVGNIKVVPACCRKEQTPPKAPLHSF